MEIPFSYASLQNCQSLAALSGESAVKVPDNSVQNQKPGGESLQDTLIKQELDKRNNEALEIGKKIESLRKEIDHHVDKSDKIQKCMSGPMLWSFCALPMATIFSPIIVSALGFPALAPVVQKVFLGLFMGDAAVIGGMKLFQHREDKAITPLVKDAEKLKKDKAQLDKETSNIKSVKDMTDASQCDQTEIVDDGTYIEIDGLKLSKKKFSFLHPIYTRSE
ncbi:MAG: hypothetical protein AB2L14_37330 [Candidatus Xenobiia bacterium LiM19]